MFYTVLKSTYITCGVGVATIIDKIRESWLSCLEHVIRDDYIEAV